MPKVQREPILVELPDEIDVDNVGQIKKDILRAVFEGNLSIEDAERLMDLVDTHAKQSMSSVLTLVTMDPNEAVRSYQQFMRQGK